MTTHSGREYSVYVQTMSGTEQTGRGNEEPGLTQLLQALLSDCQEEIRLERVRHEQELAQHQEERRV